MEIKINDVDYSLKYSIKGMLYFEQIAGKSFGEFNASMTDLYVLFYAFILSSNTDKEPIPFEKFIEACDENPNLIRDFNKFFKDAQSINEQFDKEEPKTKGRSKKKV